MALGKMLNLGGIDNRPPKANQSMGRFRVARNVQPTPDGRIIPRYENALYSVVAGTQEVMAMAQYDSSLLTLKAVDDTFGGSYYELYKDTAAIPSGVYATKILRSGVTETYSQQVTSYRYNNTTFFQCPYDGYLLKYDGVELRRASCAQPIISSTDADVTGAPGTKFVRVIQHSMDFDNNEPCSEFVEFSTNVAATLNVNTGQTGTNLIGQTNVTPNSIIGIRNLIEPFFIGTATYNAGTQDFTLSSTGNLASFGDIGAYVFVSATKLTTAQTGVGYDTYGVALRIKSLSPVRLDANDAYVMDTNRDWRLEDVNGTTMAAAITYGTKTYFSFWESTSSNGVYYFRDIKPSFPHGASTYPTTVTLTGALTATAGSDTSMLTISSVLNYWYDTISKKLDINSTYNYGGENADNFFGTGGRPFYCMTTYQDVLLLANDNGIYFSDVTSGGSFEQFVAESSLAIGNKEFGRITSICGTQDFLFVSRERKNYYVAGNILTGNYRVQEIVESELGAWSNNASILVKDSVVFINSLGVFQIMGGGKASPLSEKCPKNFAAFDSMNVNEDVVFRMEGYSSNVVNFDNQFSMLDNGLAVAYDEFRELLVFCKKGESQTGNPIFMLHTKTGEFYEWDGVLAGKYISELCFIQAEMYVGFSDYTSLLAGVYVEDRTINQTYFQTNPVKLFSTWLTAGEPSLEKSLLQLKIFGRVQTIGTTSGLGVVSFKDWDYSTRITNTQYFPNDTSLTLNNQVQYSHKKRLNSDKVLSASVGIEIATNGTAPDLLTFELESMEIEFNPIQEGMKK